MEDFKHAGVIGSHWRGLTLYKMSFSGSQLVDWLHKEKGMGKCSYEKPPNRLYLASAFRLLTVAVSCQPGKMLAIRAWRCCRRSTWLGCMAVGWRVAVLARIKTPRRRCTACWKTTLIHLSMQDALPPAIPYGVGQVWTEAGIHSSHPRLTLTYTLQHSLIKFSLAAEPADDSSKCVCDGYVGVESFSGSQWFTFLHVRQKKIEICRMTVIY